MKTLQEIQEFFKNDQFATQNGLIIDSVTPDETICSVTLEPRHRNAAGGVMGGLIFTLCDFAFAVAANHQTPQTVTLNSTIDFLSNTKGTALTAKAICLHRTRRFCRYQIKVTDNTNTLIATATATGCNTQ